MENMRKEINKLLDNIENDRSNDNLLLNYFKCTIIKVILNAKDFRGLEGSKILFQRFKRSTSHKNNFVSKINNLQKIFRNF